ncbi:MAG: hypothetical protein FWF82_02135 [Oscillospiraceae bacterium]|nr:hypothetical protein [Oscillospiraceae bacterium]
MDKYNLQPDESVIMKCERILYGGIMSGYNDELLLTNLNLILVKKGMFGKTKNVQHFPVNQIKKFNEKAQVMISKQQNGLPKLEVYFQNGQESFGFENKREAEKFANNIVRLLAGENDFDTDITMKGAITETLKDTFDTFKGVFGKAQEKVTKDCVSCGAAITGLKSQTIRCRYCGREQQL